MDPAAIDQIRVQLDPESLLTFNVLIGLMNLGLSLHLTTGDFKRVLLSPKALAVGLGAQVILLPLFACLLTMVLNPAPSIALGMILIAACPGGNLSNILTYLARGNTALSIGMTAVCTATAVLVTPFNLALWGRLNPATAPILKGVSLDPIYLFMSLFMILGVPLFLGMILAHIFPSLGNILRKPFRGFSFLALLVFMGIAMRANGEVFVKGMGMVGFLVFLGNGLFLAIGYFTGRILNLDRRDRRAVCLEAGIQNSALSLVLIFNFFEGLGGMALVAVCWGIWQIFSGVAVALLLSRRPLPERGDRP